MYARRVSRLTVTDHDRDAAGMRYIYPVVSRRAGGVSIGVNLNPNNACNWRCVYCQVPGLVRGKAPQVDLPRLQRELDSMLNTVLNTDFMQTQVPEGARRLNDIALSGNGEPTSSPQLEAVMEKIGQAIARFGLEGKIKVVMITNGSLAEQPSVTRALTALAELNGEVWFKLDRATPEGIEAVNSTRIAPEDQLRRLSHVAELCPSWVQTCMFELDGEPPSEAEVQAYLRALQRVMEEGAALKGVLLYSLARPSHQPEASRLSPVSGEWLERLGARIEEAGLTAKVTR